MADSNAVASLPPPQAKACSAQSQNFALSSRRVRGAIGESLKEIPTRRSDQGSSADLGRFLPNRTSPNLAPLPSNLRPIPLPSPCPLSNYPPSLPLSKNPIGTQDLERTTGDGPQPAKRRRLVQKEVQDFFQMHFGVKVRTEGEEKEIEESLTAPEAKMRKIIFPMGADIGSQNEPWTPHLGNWEIATTIVSGRDGHKGINLHPLARLFASSSAKISEQWQIPRSPLHAPTPLPPQKNKVGRDEGGPCPVVKIRLLAESNVSTSASMEKIEHFLQELNATYKGIKVDPRAKLGLVFFPNHTERRRCIHAWWLRDEGGSNKDLAFPAVPEWEQHLTVMSVPGWERTSAEQRRTALERLGSGVTLIRLRYGQKGKAGALFRSPQEAASWTGQKIVNKEHGWEQEEGSRMLIWLDKCKQCGLLDSRGDDDGECPGCIIAECEYKQNVCVNCSSGEVTERTAHHGRRGCEYPKKIKMFYEHQVLRQLVLGKEPSNCRAGRELWPMNIENHIRTLGIEVPEGWRSQEREKKLRVGTWNVNTASRTKRRELIRLLITGKKFGLLALQEVVLLDEVPKPSGYDVILPRNSKNFQVNQQGQRGQTFIVDRKYAPERIDKYCRESPEILCVKLRFSTTTMHVFNVYQRGNDRRAMDLINGWVRNDEEIKNWITLGDMNTHHEELGNKNPNEAGRGMWDLMGDTGAYTLNKKDSTHARGNILDHIVMDYNSRAGATFVRHPRYTSDHHVLESVLDVPEYEIANTKHWVSRMISTIPDKEAHGYERHPFIVGCKEVNASIIQPAIERIRKIFPPDRKLLWLKKENRRKIQAILDEAMEKTLQSIRKLADLYFVKEEREQLYFTYEPLSPDLRNMLEEADRLHRMLKMIDGEERRAAEKRLDELQENMGKESSKLREKSWKSFCKGMMEANSTKKMFREFKRSKGSKKSVLMTKGVPIHGAEEQRESFELQFLHEEAWKPSELYDHTIKRLAWKARKSACGFYACKRNSTDKKENHTFAGNKKSEGVNDALTWEDFLETLKQNTSNTPGPDGISLKLVRDLHEELLKGIFDLFSVSFRVGHFPTCLKVADIKPIPKKGINKFRPISLLSVIGKLYERMLQKRLRRFVILNDIISPHQAGARHGAQCLHHLGMMTQLIDEAFRKRLGYMSVFLDIKSAFPSVTPEQCSKVLYREGLRGELLFVLIEFMSERLASIRHAGLAEQYKRSDCGTPQGSPLAPLIFIIFIEGLLRKLRKRGAKGYIDDIEFGKLTGTNAENLEDTGRVINRYLRTCEIWSAEHGLAFHPEKCKVVFFRSKETAIDGIMPIIRLYGRVVDYVDKYEYLGMILDQHLMLDEHCERLIQRIRERTGFILRVVRPLAGEGIQRRRLLYTSTVQSVFDYGSAIWGRMNMRGNLSKSANKVCRELGRSFTCIMGLPISSKRALSAFSIELLPPQDRVKLSYLGLYIHAQVQGTWLFKKWLTWDRKVREAEMISMGYHQPEEGVRFKRRVTLFMVMYLLAEKYDLKLGKVLNNPPPIKTSEPVEVHIMDELIPKRAHDQGYRAKARRMIKVKIDEVTSGVGNYTERWTDGSAKDDEDGNRWVGSAYVKKDGERISEAKAFGVCRKGSAYLGELDAIEKASADTPTMGTYTVYVSDAKSLVEMLGKECPQDPVVRELQKLIHTRTPRSCIIWCPSHCFIQGNHQADVGAGEGADIARRGSVGDLPPMVAIKTAKAYAKQLLREKHKEEIKTYIELQESKNTHKAINPKCLHFPIPARKIRRSAYLFKAFLGCTHNRFLKLRGVIDDDVCPLCNAGPHTVEHIMTECETVRGAVMERLENVFEIEYEGKPEYIFFPPMKNIVDRENDYYTEVCEILYETQEWVWRMNRSREGEECPEKGEEN